MLFKTIIKFIIFTFLFSIPTIAQQSISLSELEKRTSSASDKSDLNKNKPIVDEKVNFSELEQGVFDEINNIRRNPLEYINYLEEYKKVLNDKILFRPNQPRFMMVEGKSAIDGAISALQKSTNLNFLKASKLLTLVAINQLNDLKENPKLGHFGKDGSDLKKRMGIVGKMGKFASENINYKDTIARQTLLTMIIDDGVESRTHRKNILNSDFNMVGVSCGEASNKEMICVFVFADSFDDIKSIKAPIEF